MEIVQKILDGDIRAVARLMRDIDDEIPSAKEILKELYPHTGKAYVIGFTGSPGVGKSTLVDRLVDKLRAEGKTVGILAIDPTSPFTGGAILGDRIRMQRHFLDSGVFIRSLATRGHFGGLTRSTHDMIDVLDAMGKDFIIVETVGVGQDEIEIAHTAHTTVLVTVPGMGDEVQAIKAGIMEIGDIFVVNKSDREGSRKTVRELRNLVELGLRRHKAEGPPWEPPIIETVANKNKGIDELYEAIMKHRKYLFENDKTKLEQVLYDRAKLHFVGILRDQLFKTVIERAAQRGENLDELVSKIVHRDVDPYTLANTLVERELGDNK